MFDKNSLYDLMVLINTVYNPSLPIDCVYNTVARIAMSGYNGNVVITCGNYLNRKEYLANTPENLLYKFNDNYRLMDIVGKQIIAPDGVHAKDGDMHIYCPNLHP